MMRTESPIMSLAVVNGQPAAEHVALARALYAMRSGRFDLMPGELFGEPGWDMLLDLYVSEAEGRRLSVTSLCIGAFTSVATGLRYLGILEQAGLARRLPDHSDGRRFFVELTDAGRDAMTKVFDRFTSAGSRIQSRRPLTTGFAVPRNL